MNHWLLWFLIAVIFAIIEIITAGFFIIWFGIGALAAMLVSIFIKNFLIQLTVFTIVSILLLFMTRKFISKVTKGSGKPTNIDAVIGKIGLVTQDIPALDNPGIVKISGEIWSAVSHDSEPIPQGTKVKVLEVRGVRLVVKKTD